MEGGGASWVHNIQAGYCLYHWYYDPAKILVELAVAAELSGDLTAAYMGNYADDVHMEGVVEGLVSAWILDKFVFKNKRPAF